MGVRRVEQVHAVLEHVAVQWAARCRELVPVRWAAVGVEMAQPVEPLEEEEVEGGLRTQLVRAELAVGVVVQMLQAEVPYPGWVQEKPVAGARVQRPRVEEAGVE